MLNMLLILGALTGIGCTIKFTRRGFLINSFIILAIALFVLAILPSASTLMMVIAFAVFTLVLSAVSNLVGVFPAESFPTEVRASGIGLATAVSRLGSAISTFLLPVSVAGIGLSPTMGILAGILALGALISWAWAPETKALTLNQACTVQEGSDVVIPVAKKSAISQA
jgi:putative MFS transporter